MESTTTEAAAIQQRQRLRAEVLEQVVRGNILAPYCAICFGNIVRRTLTGSCLHQFCYRCIHRRVPKRCPLCNSVYNSLIHDIVNHLEYKETYVFPGDPHDPMLMSNETVGSALEEFFKTDFGG